MKLLRYSLLAACCFPLTPALAGSLTFEKADGQGFCFLEEGKAEGWRLVTDGQEWLVGLESMENGLKKVSLKSVKVADAHAALLLKAGDEGTLQIDQQKMQVKYRATGCSL